MIKLILTLFLLIHVCSCIHIWIGDWEDGWITSDSDFGEHDKKHYNAYPTALYFIVTTFTTVGYGDFSGHSSMEMIYIMVLELAGLAVFSSVIGSL